MKKVCLIILIILPLLVASMKVCAQHKRALLIGISNYDTALTNYEWNNIHGVEDVELLAPLLKKQGFKISKIIDSNATYVNIIHSFDKLLASCGVGDIVYVHFSTHGQPIEDKNGDESDGWDEAIVPIDAYKNYHKGKYTGQNHLVDDEISKYTEMIRKRIGPKGVLYVVVDACHAGTSARGEENIRGTHIGFSASSSKIYNPPVDKKNRYKLNSASSLANVVFIEACRADQVNREIKVNGKLYGALSYNVAYALNSVKLGKDSEIFINSVKKSAMQVGRWPINQNMVIEVSF